MAKKNKNYFIFNLFQNTYESSGKICKSILRFNAQFSWLRSSLLLVFIMEEDISTLNFILLHLSYTRKEKNIECVTPCMLYCLPHD
jgi:hypothetical protein